MSEQQPTQQDQYTEQQEEIVVTDFSGGMDIRQYPPTYLRDRAMPGKLAHLLGARVEQDGTLKWLRNQFMISSPAATPKALWEFVADVGGVNYNQLVMLLPEGYLYTLDTDWENETPTQWEFGYELFNGTSWMQRYTDLATQTTPDTPFGLAQIDDGLIISHRNDATKKWTGIAVEEVGLATPGTALEVSKVPENFTVGWTETDSGSYLTVAADTITAASMPDNATSRVYKDFGDYGFKLDFEFTFEVKITAQADGADLTVVGLSNVADAIRSSWTDYLAVTAQRIGAVYYLGIESLWGIGGAAVVPVSVNTSYYCKFRGYSEYDHAVLEVWSDADYTTWVGSTSAKVSPSKFRYLYVMTGGGSGVQTSSGYIDSLFVGGYTLGGQLPVGTYSYYYTQGNDSYESMPSPILDIPVRMPGYMLDLTGISTGGSSVTWRKLYRAYTADSAPGSRGADFQYVTTIENNIDTTYQDNDLQSELGDPIDFDHARPPRGDILVYHSDRLFMAGLYQTSDSYDESITSDLANKLYYSQLGYPDYWPEDNWIEVGDDSAIVALASWGNFLIIIKESSVFTLAVSGDSMVLRQIDQSFGAMNPCSVCSAPNGVVWTSPQGLVQYNGQNTMLLLETRSDQPFTMPTTIYPWLCYHQGYIYFQPEGSKLLRYDMVRNLWEMAPHTCTANIVGMRAFNWGKFQSHVLAYVDWVGTGGQYITVLDPVAAFANGNGAGTRASTRYAPIYITLPPLVPAPGEDIRVLEVHIDGDYVRTTD